jgi:hypothetical protein
MVALLINIRFTLLFVYAALHLRPRPKNHVNTGSEW